MTEMQKTASELLDIVDVFLRGCIDDKETSQRAADYLGQLRARIAELEAAKIPTIESLHSARIAEMDKALENIEKFFDNNKDARDAFLTFMGHDVSAFVERGLERIKNLQQRRT